MSYSYKLVRGYRKDGKYIGDTEVETFEDDNYEGAVKRLSELFESEESHRSDLKKKCKKGLIDIPGYGECNPKELDYRTTAIVKDDSGNYMLWKSMSLYFDAIQYRFKL